MLNKTEFAAPLGVSVPTISQWLGVLETTAQILIVPPFYENLGKRLIKSPKVYIADAGLACHLLGIDTAAELAKSPFLGGLFEGFIAAEIIKTQVHAGRRPELYYFRDEQGLEVDFLIPEKNGGVSLVESEKSFKDCLSRFRRDRLDGLHLLPVGCEKRDQGENVAVAEPRHPDHQRRVVRVAVGKAFRRSTANSKA